MANIANNQVIRFAVVCSQENQFSQNVFHLRCYGVNAPGISIEQAVFQMAVRMSAVFIPALAGNARYEGVIGQVLKPVLGLRAVSAEGAGEGTFAAEPMPPQTCGFIQKRTAVGGRRNRGRMYVPFPAKDAGAMTGKITALYNDALEDIALALTGPIDLVSAPGQITCEPVVYHRNDGSTEAVTSYTFPQYFATIRRRGLIGSGDANPLL